MWSPTHIQVTVLSAKGLLAKGKNGTNNCFVTIALGKEKYQTSIKDKSPLNVDWREECELTIPERGNRAELILTCLHRNGLGMDDFLGQVTLPLNEMDAYERPRARWYKLQSKPGKEKKDKERGELEVRIAFTVKAGSLTDLSKKEKNKSSTLGLGGSLLSLGTLEKRKSLKKFAKSLGSKVHITGKKKDKGYDNESISGSVSSLSTPGSGQFQERRYGGSQAQGEADPGVISEDDDEFAFDNLSNKSSASSINLKSRQGHQQHLRLSPSPLATQSNSSQSTVHTYSNEDDGKARTNQTPVTATNGSEQPVKPVRTSLKNDPPTETDEWEMKLYGKKLDSKSDSLKRMSWDTRIPLNKNNFEDQMYAASVTAPTSPTLEQKSHEREQNEKSKSKNPFEDSSTNPFDDDSVSEPNQAFETPKQVFKTPSPMPVVEKKEKSEKRFSNKLKFLRKDKHHDDELRSKNLPSERHERIIIGHENDIILNGRKQIEVPPALLKKYDGKSREEVILIAHELENEVKIQKIKMKEMEDYLDNLLLRVMETHPKILQNPYRMQSSVKSG